MIWSFVFFLSQSHFFILSLLTLLLNTDWIINWLGLSDIQQCFRPPYLYTLIFTSDLVLKKKIFSGLYKRRVHNSRTAVVSVGDKAETLIRLLFYSRHHFVRNIQKHNAKKQINERHQELWIFLSCCNIWNSK